MRRQSRWMNHCQNPVGRSMEYLADEKGTLTISDVQNKKLADRWKSSSVDNPGFGFTNDVYWVRFTIDNTAMKRSTFTSSRITPSLTISSCTFRTAPIQGGGSRTQKTLYRTALSIPDLHLPAADEGAVKHDIVPSIPDNQLHEHRACHLVPASFTNMVNVENIMLVLFNGIIIIMIVYNMLLFMVIRWIEYFFTASFLFLSYIHGYDQWHSLSIPLANHPGWAALSVPVTLCVLFIFITIFCIELVDLRKRRHESRYRNILFKSSLVMLSINTLLFFLCFIVPYRYSMSISTIMAGVVLFIICIQGVIYTI